MGGAVDHYTSYSQKSTFPMMEELSAGALRMFPFLKDVNILRQWTGICDMTPDYAPIMGPVSGLDGFLLDCGWGHLRFQGRAHFREDDGGAYRHRPDPRPDKAILARPLQGRQAGE